MLNKLFLGFIFCWPFFLSGQNWKINTVVFGGDFLTQINKEQILISNNSKGFWKSDVFGENFFYQNYILQNGARIFPSNSGNFINDKLVCQASKTSIEPSPKFLVRYNSLNNNLLKISNDSLIKTLISPFFSPTHQALSIKADTLFKLDSAFGQYQVLKIFNPQNFKNGFLLRVKPNISNSILFAIKTSDLNENKQFVGKVTLYSLQENLLELNTEFSFISENCWFGNFQDEISIVSGSFGQVFKRESSSVNWLNIGLGKNFEVRCNFQNQDSGVCYNADYFEGRNFYYTTNGGEDWLEIELPKDLINVKGAAIKNNKVLVFGFDTVYQQTRLYQTDDITQHSIINTIKGGQPAPIGLTETKIQNNINIYPNPTNQNFTIEATEIPKAIKLFNIVGQLVYSETPMQNTNQIQVSHLPKGLYFVQIHQQNGESLLRKVVVN